MKTYDVMFKVRVRAENVAEAKAQVIEVFNSSGILYISI